MSNLKRLKRATNDPARNAERRLPYLRREILSRRPGMSQLQIFRTYEHVTELVAEYLYGSHRYRVVDPLIEQGLDFIHAQAREVENRQEGELSTLEILFASSYHWVNEGSIVIELDRSVAISLLLTAPPAEGAFEDSVTFPWKCFKVRLPEGVIPARGGTSVKEVLAFYNDKLKRVQVADDRYYLDGADELAFADDGGEESVPHTDASMQAVRLLADNLMAIVGSDPDVFIPATIRNHRARAQCPLELLHVPVPQVYTANPAGLWGDRDTNERVWRMRQAGVDYQVMTWFRRGHWKMQRCGKALAEIKRVRVAPTFCHRSPDLVKDETP